MMEAGRELDALVAEKVMCWPKDGLSASESYRDENMPHYSTSIEAAWLVWEEIADRFDFANIQTCCRAEGVRWCAILANDPGVFYGQAATAPLAIVRAVLAAVGVDAQEGQEWQA